MPISFMSMFCYTHRYQFVTLFTFAIMFTGDNKAFLYLFYLYTSARRFRLFLFPWPLLSQAVTTVIWCFNQWSPSPRDRLYHGSWKSIIHTCQISKFHGHLCKVKALSSLRELDQLRFPQLTISQGRITGGHLFSMPGSIDHCWTTPSLCTNGGFDPLQRHPYSPISDWWHRVYIEIWGPAPFFMLDQQSTLPQRTSQGFK